MRIGCRLRDRLTQATPLSAMLNVQDPRFGDRERADHLVTARGVPLENSRLRQGPLPAPGHPAGVPVTTSTVTNDPGGLP